jgi:hypothetical protein
MEYLRSSNRIQNKNSIQKHLKKLVSVAIFLCQRSSRPFVILSEELEGGIHCHCLWRL